MKKSIALCLLLTLQTKTSPKINHDNKENKQDLLENLALESNDIRSYIAKYFKQLTHEQETLITPRDIDILLSNSRAIPTKHAGLHAGIEFLCCDIKFDKKEQEPASLKFCEIGNGIFAGRSATKVHIDGSIKKIYSPYWNLLWHYLKNFNLPVWFVGPYSEHKKKYYDDFVDLGGLESPSLEALQEDERFLEQAQKQLLNPNSIHSYAGIIVYNGPFSYRREKPSKALTEFKAFRERYPQFIVVSDTANTHIIRKNRTYTLFNDPLLKEYLPKYKLYKTEYTQGLARRVKRDLPGDWFVIKPIGSSLSAGVIVVNNKMLNSTLRLILRDTDQISDKADRSLRHWKKYKSDEFIIAQYAPSKAISVGGDNYDPTMRIVFMLSHSQNVITVTILAGFWKIPLKPLSGGINLTQQHVTIPDIDAFFVGIPVAQMILKRQATL